MHVKRYSHRPFRYFVNCTYLKVYLLIVEDVDDEWNSFLKDWDTLINSLTLATYLRNYAKLESKATYHLGIKQVLDYLNQVWLDKYKENFVSAWTNQVLNFHNHTNNRVESQHAKLKKFSHTQHGNLDKFFNRIER